MKKCKFLLLLVCAFPFLTNAQGTPQTQTHPTFEGQVSSVEYVTSLLSRPHDLVPFQNTNAEAKDKKSHANKLVIGKDPQTTDDYFVINKNEAEQTALLPDPDLVFDAYTSSSQPTDPALAVGPDHVFVVFNTGFTIYDKAGIQLLGQTAPSPAIFPSGGCCDLTVSYDNAADRWVLSFLAIGAGAQIAVSDGSNPLTSGWYVYSISAIRDYQKLSIWSDGYYMTDQTGATNKVWALERSEMLLGNAGAQILGFDLPNLVTSGFYSPQFLNISDDNLPAAGGATIVYLQDDAWGGVANDHIKLWTLDVDWVTTANSTISAAQEIPTTPYISVFDNGSFVNLAQPAGGPTIDALQAIIMNQAQFRKFDTHNSAIFNFVVDTDASAGELAGVRWIELRQSGDNQPWSLYQEGTYTAPDGKHAWNASMAMDGDGNIGMGYTSMSGPATPTTVHVGSYYTGRLAGDPLGTMTGAEGTIATGDRNIPGTRYGDYAKMDIDPSDDQTFWFITEYMNGVRSGVVGNFVLDDTPAYCESQSASADEEYISRVQINAIDNSSGAQTYSDFTALSTDLQENRTYSISVTPTWAAFVYNEAYAVWIDYNNDNDFDDAGELVWSKAPSTDTINTGTFTVPSGTSLASVRMRVSMKYNGIPTPCESFLYGEVEDYTINLKPDYCPSQSNNADEEYISRVQLNTLDNSSGAQTYSNFSAISTDIHENQNYTITVTPTWTGFVYQEAYAVWIDYNNDQDFDDTGELVWSKAASTDTPNSGTFFVPTGTSLASVGMRVSMNYFSIPSPCQSLVFGEVEDYTVNLKPALPPYCSSGSLNANEEYISRVQLNTIDNTSGAQTYSDFTSISTLIEEGDTYTISVTPTWTGFIYNEAYAAWIDYNNDQDFDDAGELVWSKIASQDTLNSGTFTVPTGTSLSSVRMRVSMNYINIPSSCQSFTFGEVEDYTVNLVQSSPIIEGDDEITVNNNFKNERIDRSDLENNNSLDTDKITKRDHSNILKTFTEISNDNIKMYPNPTNSLLHIDILEGDFDDMMIFASTGQVVYQTIPIDRKMQIDVVDLTPGMYFVRFVSNGLAVTKRFIKE